MIGNPKITHAPRVSQCSFETRSYEGGRLVLCLRLLRRQLGELRQWQACTTVRDPRRRVMRQSNSARRVGSSPSLVLIAIGRANSRRRSDECCPGARFSQSRRLNASRQFLDNPQHARQRGIRAGPAAMFPRDQTRVKERAAYHPTPGCRSSLSSTSRSGSFFVCRVAGNTATADSWTKVATPTRRSAG